MQLIVKFILLAVLMQAICCSAFAGDLKVIDAWWRSDANPWAKKQVWEGEQWREGWKLSEQFYPKNFKPVGSIHVVLKNDTGAAAKVQLIDVDGAKIEDIITNPERAGLVVWDNIFPREAAPGEWVECILRLRSVPKKDVKLGFDAGGKRVEVTVPAKTRKTRIESISFSPKTDKIYIYTRALDGSVPAVKSIRLDGADVKSLETNGPAKSGLVLSEASMDKPWEWGTYHLVEVTLADGTNLAYPIRAWDNFFSVGLFGNITKERVAEAKFHGINTYVACGNEQLLDEMGVNYVPGTGGGRLRTPTQSGRLFYYNWDEPDGADTHASETIPYLERLGVNAEKIVLPIIWQQWDTDPNTPSLVLVDGTYKPLHWYVYGQISDVYSTDPYVPLGRTQLEFVPNALETARDACAPNPLTGTIWATSIGNESWTNWNQRRQPEPIEERMMVFYALASGVKGIFYFADVDNFQGEELTGVSHYRPLWHEIRRINKDMAVLTPHLSIGCPAGAPVQNKKVWMRSLMCGNNAMVSIVVNRQHEINYEDRDLMYTHKVAKDIDMVIPLPESMQEVTVREVIDGSLVPVEFRQEPGKVKMYLDSVDTARAFLIETK